MRPTRTLLLLAALATVLGSVRSCLLDVEGKPSSAGSTAEPVVRVVHKDGPVAARVKLLDPSGRAWFVGADGFVAVPRTLHGVEVIAVDCDSERELGRYHLDLAGKSLPTLVLEH
ncbi:MAG: hypothetical protein HZB39_16885 [Planctomycetes bacterium]|nr:hypothetical protein [Planctomycetota bacterium]